MEQEIINCYELDIKQNFPEDLRLSRVECESLKQKNNILFNVLVGFGTGLLAVFLLKLITSNKDNKQKQKE
ncbi:hypothetical protein [Winogradskyella luteola]|uniref:Uncharacterized protein n=1 Tax=Winogradskyella luteola TaxID=2828330 RepID=A0A9X1JR67_9FLAO|nr:hypothetical protein [Winogradskyella luteola]MBV7270564.1 hypothetical protein [Winogradskyella luteola]